MTTTELPLLETHGLCGRYGQIEAIHGIDITVERGAIVALLGANGSGKTSTLRAITGTIKCEGTVVYDGVALARRTPEDAARAGIAHVPEGRGTLSAPVGVGEPHAGRLHEEPQADAGALRARRRLLPVARRAQAPERRAR